MSEAKILRPPFRNADQKMGLVEDPRYKRWSKDMLRTMKHGMYDWKNHEEKPV